jgi:hypothetical protein
MSQSEVFNSPYMRPETPEQVNVHLTTRDGRRWKAEWRETEPTSS